MELIRIGDKIISLSKVDRAVRDILQARSEGHSQGEVAQQLGVDRAFVSHLEGLGEIRKGRSIAVVGFPVANKMALASLLAELGVERALLMTEAERQAFVRHRSGVELVNEIFRLAEEFRQYEVIILIGSEPRIRLLRAFVSANREVIGLALGQGPLDHDVAVDLTRVRTVIQAFQRADGGREKA